MNARIDRLHDAAVDGKAARATGVHLASANDEPEPRYIRQPQSDTRVSRGHITNGNAWLEVASGEVRYFMIGYDANAGRWLSLNDPRRKEMDA